MTTKSDLLDHIALHHKRLKIAKHFTLEKLGKLHAYEHWRYGGLDHYHEGSNLGPNDRPQGWYDGTGVQLKKKGIK